ncbi:MAG: flagellar assembly protein FliW [Rhodoglobus sp.]|jgi:flagellar assembly factor FliW|nr:flagellar assembly protein FliW [Rhodoglobus sp.]
MTGLVTFIAPPPGLSPLVDFDLEPVAEADGLYTLRSLEAPEIRLFVIDAPVYLPDYNPEMSVQQLESIGATETSEVRVLVVTTLSDGGPSANLMAPILMHATSGEATQVILDGDDWPLRMQLGA